MLASVRLDEGASSSPTCNAYFPNEVLGTFVDAGKAWKEYRSRGGSRKRIVSDFLIASHALNQADRLLTRDRGFYRSYYQKLQVVDSSSPTE